MSSENKPVEASKLEIQIDDDMAQGVYTNLAVINHTDAEFTFDFIYVQPQAPRGKVRSRIITSPLHAKALLQALSENLRRYEQMHGPIETGSKEQPRELAPYH